MTVLGNNFKQTGSPKPPRIMIMASIHQAKVIKFPWELTTIFKKSFVPSVFASSQQVLLRLTLFVNWSEMILLLNRVQLCLGMSAWSTSVALYV